MRGHAGHERSSKRASTLTNILAAEVQYAAALPVALEACRIVERFGVEGIARSQALTDSVGVRLNRGAPCEATLPDAHRAYELARSILFPQECVRSAIMLSRLYSAGGRHREAVRFATVSRHCAAAVSFDSGVVAQAISCSRAHTLNPGISQRPNRARAKRSRWSRRRRYLRPRKPTG